MSERSDLPAKPRDWDKAIEVYILLNVEQLSHGEAAKRVGLRRATVERYTKAPWWPEVARRATDQLRASFHNDTIAALSWLLRQRHPATVLAMARHVVPEMQEVVPRQAVEQLIGVFATVVQEFVPVDRKRDAMQVLRQSQTKILED